MGRPRSNLTNKKFGRLTALYSDATDKNGTKIWQCKCQCGNAVEVTSSNLNNGSTQSCGCYKKDYVTNKNRKRNVYYFLNDCVLGYTTKNEIFIIDWETYAKIKNNTWSYNSHGYLRTRYNKTTFYLHKIILFVQNNKQVDHINGHPYDNRKKNLRVCTELQNDWNHKISRNNTSGYTGVYFDKRSNKFFARITCKKIIYYLGYFDSIEEAYSARQNAEIKHYGEFRRKKC